MGVHRWSSENPDPGPVPGRAGIPKKPHLLHAYAPGSDHARVAARNQSAVGAAAGLWPSITALCGRHARRARAALVRARWIKSGSASRDKKSSNCRKSFVLALTGRDGGAYNAAIETAPP